MRARTPFFPSIFANGGSVGIESRFLVRSVARGITASFLTGRGRAFNPEKLGAIFVTLYHLKPCRLEGGQPTGCQGGQGS